MGDERVHLVCRRPTWYWPVLDALAGLVCLVAAFDYWERGSHGMAVLLVFPAVAFWPLVRHGAAAYWRLRRGRQAI